MLCTFTSSTSSVGLLRNPPHQEGLDTIVCGVEEDGIDDADFIATLDRDHQQTLQIAGIHHGFHSRDGHVPRRNALVLVRHLTTGIRMGISSANEPVFAGLARKHCVETFGEDRALVLSQQALVEQYGGLIPPNGTKSA
jgi:hypothetical protein